MYINMFPSGKEGRNLFTDNQDALRLSRDAYYFMAGTLRHMKAITTLINPPVNPYKRLIPGLDAPIYIAWPLISNCSFLTRISSPRGESTWIELRYPDSVTNPYLALAACLSIDLDEIEKKIGLLACVEGNMFTMEPEELRERNVERIPETLGDAIEAHDEDSLMKGVPGEHIYTKYLEAKEQEWRDFRAQATDREVSQYLYKY